MGIYQRHMAEYADAGLPVFPVAPRNKRPAVKGWRRATPNKARSWADLDHLASKDGIGLLMGDASGITEIDVDAKGDAWLATAIERFGETPIVIRTASGKSKLWYRHAGERRLIRPQRDAPIDVLGAGVTIAPPTWREDLSASYSFVMGGIKDVASLPTIRKDVGGFPSLSPSAVQRGSRNDSLWRHCMGQARHCDDVDTLLDVAETWNSDLLEPLNSAEVERVVRQAWSYEILGRNYVGLKRPQISERDAQMDNLIDRPDAFALLCLFERYHSGRESFSIAPAAMSDAGNPPWHRTRIEKARDVLLERGHLKEVSPPKRGVRSGCYRLIRQMPDSVKDHTTPSPPS